MAEGLAVWDLPAERRNEKDWWINLVDRRREGVRVRARTSEHVTISSQEAAGQAAKLVLVATWRRCLVGDEAGG